MELLEVYFEGMAAESGVGTGWKKKKNFRPSSKGLLAKSLHTASERLSVAGRLGVNTKGLICLFSK